MYHGRGQGQALGQGGRASEHGGREVGQQELLQSLFKRERGGPGQVLWITDVDQGVTHVLVLGGEDLGQQQAVVQLGHGAQEGRPLRLPGGVAGQGPQHARAEHAVAVRQDAGDPRRSGREGPRGLQLLRRLEGLPQAQHRRQQVPGHPRGAAQDEGGVAGGGRLPDPPAPAVDPPRRAVPPGLRTGVRVSGVGVEEVGHLGRDREQGHHPGLLHEGRARRRVRQAPGRRLAPAHQALLPAVFPGPARRPGFVAGPARPAGFTPLRRPRPSLDHAPLLR